MDGVWLKGMCLGLLRGMSGFGEWMFKLDGVMDDKMEDQCGIGGCVVGMG